MFLKMVVSNVVLFVVTFFLTTPEYALTQGCLYNDHPSVRFGAGMLNNDHPSLRFDAGMFI